MRESLVSTLLLIIPMFTFAQESYFIVFPSNDGISNVVGASVYSAKFVEKKEKQEAPYMAWLQTSLSTDRDAALLKKNVINPITGHPSEGHTIYMKFEIISRDEKTFEIKPLKSEKLSFAKKPANDGYFYVLVKAKTIEEAMKKVIYETFADISPD